MLYWTWPGEASCLSAEGSGFAVVSGDWKGVVMHCAGDRPGPRDMKNMRVYNLPNDPAEEKNVASTEVGTSQAKRLLDLVTAANVSCECHSCTMNCPLDIVADASVMSANATTRRDHQLSRAANSTRAVARGHDDWQRRDRHAWF